MRTSPPMVSPLELPRGNTDDPEIRGRVGDVVRWQAP